MIDQNGRLFGKISIIDICIVLAIILAAVFIVRQLTSKAEIRTSAEAIQITFFAEEAAAYIADYMAIGARMENDDTGDFLGYSESFEIGECLANTVDKTGTPQRAPKEDFCSITVTGTAMGQRTQTSVLIGGNRYEVGKYVTLRVGLAKIPVKVMAIQ